MQALKEVFVRPPYVMIATSVAWMVFSLALWLPHWQLITQVMSTASFMDSVTFLINIYGSIATNFTIFSGVVVIILSILFGINVSLMTYLIRRQMTVQRDVATNMGGMVFGVLGIGCAACGSVILTGFLALFGGVWILAYLPFGGEELGVMGVVLLGYAMYSLSKRISKPRTCNN